MDLNGGGADTADMTPPRPFGRALCAMITPFTPEGMLDAGPVREPLQPAGREATAGLRRVYEELLAATG